MIRLLACCCILTVAAPVSAATIPAKTVTATAGGSSATRAQDGSTRTAWKPGSAKGAITFGFGADTYLAKVELTVDGGDAKGTLSTAAGVTKEIALEEGANSIALPVILTKSMTLAVSGAPSGFGLSEAVFTQGSPSVYARPRLRARASSTLENKKSRYGPQLAIDGKLSTAWNEGATVATGQWLEINFDKPAFVHHVGAVIGYSQHNQKVGEVWFKNHRVKAARIDYDDGWYVDAFFEDRIAYQYVPARMELTRARITIQEVFDTLKWEDTPISEVTFIHEYVDDVKLEVAFDQDAALATNKDRRYLVVRVKGAYSVEAKRAPANVVLVVDQSGSMSEQDRMRHAREAAKLVVSGLGPEDYLSLVSFDDTIMEKLPPTLMTTDAKKQIVREIDKLQADGGTDIYGALSKASELVKRKLSNEYTNRILLLSDGKPTSGNTDPEEIAEVAAEAFRSSKVVTSTFGVGPDYNEDLMAALAQASTGVYYHITNPAQMFKVFVAEMSNIMKVVGRDASVMIDIPKALKVVGVPGYTKVKTNGSVHVVLEPISAAGEQKVVVELEPAGRLPKETEVVARLTYRDALAASRRVTLEAYRILEGTDDAAYAKASKNVVVAAEVLSTLAALELEKAATAYESGSAAAARQALTSHIAKLQKENTYLTSAVLAEEITVLKDILAQMKGSASSSSGRLAIKEAKALALVSKKRGKANASLDGADTDPNAELRRLVATNFREPGPMYGSAKPEAIIGMLVGRGLTKAKAATAANTMGYRAYNRAEYDAALSWFDTALGFDPTHVLATYNAACTWGLKKNAGKAVEYLKRLKGIKNAAARKRLQKAKKDTDLDPVRNAQAFKEFMSTI